VVDSQALAFESVVTVLSLLAVASILAGNLLALLQNNLKRILAYSSIAHMGYVLVALIAGATVDSAVDIEAVSFYLIAYVIMTLGAFGVASVISSSEKEYDSIFDYRGLFWRAPWLAAIFTGMLLSLAGIPLTVGFIGKFYLFFAAVEAGLWTLLAVMIIGSGIGLYYYLRIVYRMVKPAKEMGSFREAGIESLSAYVVLGLMFVLLLLLGVYPAPLIALIESASALL
jgi:NADH-quinone oxidoreductase subunit N